MVKKCDLGILLGGPILEQQFNQLISLFNEHLKKTIDDRVKFQGASQIHTQSRLLSSQRNANDWMRRKRKEIFSGCPSPPLIHQERSNALPVHRLNSFLLITCRRNDRWFLLDASIIGLPCRSGGKRNRSARERSWSLFLSFDYLIQLAGDRTVPIELGSRYSDDDWTQKLMTITDFVQQYCRRRVYICVSTSAHVHHPFLVSEMWISCATSSLGSGERTVIQ